MNVPRKTNSSLLYITVSIMYIFYFLSLYINRIVDLQNSHEEIVLLQNMLRDTLYISKIRIK